MKSSTFVLLTASNEYVVEYLLQQLILSKNISEALTFDNEFTALAFKDRLIKMCNLDCSVNTYIQ